MTPPAASDGKEPPEVMQVRWLYTRALLAAQDAREAVVPGVNAGEAQYLILRAQLALLDAQIEHGRLTAP